MFLSAVPNNGGIVLILSKSNGSWKIGPYCRRLDAKSGGELSASLELLKGNIGILNIGKLEGIATSVAVVGVDLKSSNPRKDALRGAELFVALNRSSKLAEWVVIDDIEEDHRPEMAHNIWLSFESRSIKNERYITQKEQRPKLAVYSEQHNEQDATFFESLLSGTLLTKDLVSTPPNALTPSEYAERIKEEFKDLDVEVTVLNRSELKTLGMNCLLGVARGSVHEPYVVIMRLGSGESPLALVGKGVTFDTGGLSLKPPRSMVGMKCDMAGSAAIVGAIKSLALMKSDANIVGIVGLVENAVSGNSYRPDDVLMSAAGKSVEIGNTDAEGRLVLCDLLHYAQRTLGCKEIVDLATLTGAISVSLGSIYAGLFANNDKLKYHLVLAGEKSGERLWRMPLDEEYAELLVSDIADLNNISPSSAGAGSVTAAEFLHSFINPGTTWAHVDIAGVACCKKNKVASDDGVTAFGVRLLCEFIHARTNVIE